MIHYAFTWQRPELDASAPACYHCDPIKMSPGKWVAVALLGHLMKYAPPFAMRLIELKLSAHISSENSRGHIHTNWSAMVICQLPTQKYTAIHALVASVQKGWFGLSLFSKLTCFVRSSQGNAKCYPRKSKRQDLRAKACPYP